MNGSAARSIASSVLRFDKWPIDVALKKLGILHSLHDSVLGLQGSALARTVAG